MTILKIDKVGHYTTPGYGIVKIPQETEDTKKIRKLGTEIKQINAETEAIKKGELSKPIAHDSSFYLKKLNVI